MKLIDEKGRFMKTINIIDLLAILFVVLLAVFVGSKLIGTSNGNQLQQEKLIYTVKVSHVEPEVWQALQEIELPDQLMASGELLYGYVNAVEAEKSTQEILTISPDGKNMQKEEKDTYDLTFTVEALIPDNEKNEVGTQEVRIGKRHIMKTVHFEFEQGRIMTAQREAIE